MFNPVASKPGLTSIPYQSSHLVLEAKLDDPILQLAAGAFLADSPNIALAVLHPRRLVVYTISEGSASCVMGIRSSDDDGVQGPPIASAASASASSSGKTLQLLKTYDHPLPRAAYNFCYGSFGSVPERDSICVQSLDGHLFFIEHAALLYVRLMQGALLPGPICYIPAANGFATVNSSMDVQYFSCQSVAMASASANAVGTKGGITPTWSVNIGDHAVSIFPARLTRPATGPALDPLPQEIVVVGEQSLFVITDDGTIRLQRKLEYNPTFASAYTVAKQTSHPSSSSSSSSSSSAGDAAANDAFALQHLLVSTYQHSLMVYKDTELIWSARMTDAPNVQTSITALGGVQGMIVALKDTCAVSVYYLGTDPPAPSAKMVESRELDYDKMNAEHRILQRTIKALSTGKPGALPEDDVAAAAASASAAAALSPSSSSSSSPYSSSSFSTASSALSNRAPLVLRAGVLSPEAIQRRGAPGFLPNDDAAVLGGRVAGRPQYVYSAVDVDLDWRGTEPLKDVKLSITCPPAFIPNAEVINIATVPVNPAAAAAAANSSSSDSKDNSEGSRVTVYFRVSKSIPFWSTQVTLTALYNTPLQEPRAVSVTLHIPFETVTSLVAPLRDFNVMVTVDINRPPPHLSILFPELVAAVAETQPDVARTASNVVTFMFRSGHDATILLSKKGARYRLQSTSVEGLAPALVELHDRLHAYFKRLDAAEAAASTAAATAVAAAGGVGGAASAGDGAGAGAGAGTSGEKPPKLVIEIKDSAPAFGDFFPVLERHFSARVKAAGLRDTLTKQLRLYRALEKRLIIRMKDKNPTPLNNLDTLLISTHASIIATTNALSTLDASAKALRCSLACATEYLLWTIRLCYGLDSRNFELLRAYLPPFVEEGSEIAWEEIVTASTSHLLRTVLTKQSVPGGGAAAAVGGAGAGASTPTLIAPPSLNAVTNLDGLKWNIQNICERIKDGARLYVRKEVGKDDQTKSGSGKSVRVPAFSRPLKQSATAPAPAPRPSRQKASSTSSSSSSSSSTPISTSSSSSSSSSSYAPKLGVQAPVAPPRPSPTSRSPPNIPAAPVIASSQSSSSSSSAPVTTAPAAVSTSRPIDGPSQLGVSTSIPEGGEDTDRVASTLSASSTGDGPVPPPRPPRASK